MLMFVCSSDKCHKTLSCPHAVGHDAKHIDYRLERPIGGDILVKSIDQLKHISIVSYVVSESEEAHDDGN